MLRLTRTRIASGRLRQSFTRAHSLGRSVDRADACADACAAAFAFFVLVLFEVRDIPVIYFYFFALLDAGEAHSIAA